MLPFACEKSWFRLVATWGIYAWTYKVHVSLASKRFIILSHNSLSLTVFKDSDGIEICDKITLNFYLRQSYHRSGNFRVIKFSCFKFSCKSIFVVRTTHEKFSLWKHYCEDVPYSSQTCAIRIGPVRLVSTTTITGWNWPIEMISLVLGDAALSSCPPPPLCFARVLQGQRSRKRGRVGKLTFFK